jgi:hypothetical protein
MADKFDVKNTLATSVTDKDGKTWVAPTVKDYKTYAKQVFTISLNASGYYETLAKPNIVEDKLLTEEESKQVKTALWNCGLVDETNKVVKEGRKLIFEQAKPAKNDYKHDYDRGTIHFTIELRKDGTPLLRNYSFHKVIIPDGTTIKECNFSQRKADTEAISGKNLTFIECNLVNNKIDPTWTIECCNISQHKREITKQTDLEDGGTELEVTISFKDKDGKFVMPKKKIELVDNSVLSNYLLYFS